MSGPAGRQPGSRRQLFGAAAAGAGATVLAACGAPSVRSQLEQDRAVAATDAQLLNHLLAVEQLSIAAYTASIPMLPAAAVGAARQFLAQELVHAGGLRSLIKDTRRRPHEPLGRYDLGHPRTGGDMLALLHEVESIQISAYLDALPSLRPGTVRMRVAGFFANDAQHLSILRFLQGQEALQDAVVTGRE